MLQGESPPPLLHSLGFCQLRSGLLPLQTIFRPSLRRPKWVLLIQSRPKWVLIVLKTTCRGPTDAKPEVDPSGSCSSRVDPSGSCSSCRRPAGDLQTPSLGRPKWVLLVLRRPKGVLIVQSRPQWVLVAQGSTLLSLVRLGDGLLTSLSVPRTIHLARGVKLPPARGVCSLAIRLTRTHRPRIANNGTTNRTKTIIFVLPRWIFF